MKLRAFNLLLSLAIVLGLAACGEKPVPTKTVSAADHEQTAPPSDGTVAERISRLIEFYEESGQFGGAVLVAQDGNIIINDLEHDPPTISAASVVGLAVLESGGDAASRTMTDLLKDADSLYRFEEIEFLLVADRLAELEKHDETCQLLKSYVGCFPGTPAIRQKLAEYCE